jgi:hypothetical protein
MSKIRQELRTIMFYAMVLLEHLLLPKKLKHDQGRKHPKIIQQSKGSERD